MHRLDKGTSGLLAVARTEPAYRSLVAQLAARQHGAALPGPGRGPVADDRGVVDAPIGRSARTPTKMAVSAAGGRPAPASPCSSGATTPPADDPARAEPETGRTHQIRVHMAAIGHPVVGDARYGTPGAGGLGVRAVLPPRLPAGVRPPREAGAAWSSPRRCPTTCELP